MSVVSVQPKDFILALFIRDDGERFLLGDNGYDFMDSQLHFSANTIENDEVEKQGADGTMLAGQVRRASVQTFDGYVGDATTPKEEIEQMRRAFIAFFLKGHHYRVVYVDCARNAWQRKGGYLVDAPEVKELFQVHPEYHVGLNFEDVNYYSYDENAEGDEITANLVQVAISSAVEGGLVWDEDGAVSEDATVVYDGDTATASGTSITVSDAVEAPLTDFKLKGETSQNGTPTPSAPVPVQTVSGENVVRISDGQGNEQSYEVNLGKNLLEMPIVSGSSNGITWTVQDDGSIILNGTSTAGVNIRANNVTLPAVEGETYTLSATGMGEAYNFGYKNSGSGENIFVVTSASPTTTAVVTSTMLSQANRLDMYIQSGKTFNNQRVTLQLEKGSQATTYAAYFTPIELCGLGDDGAGGYLYQNSIYKSGDKWYVRKEVGKAVLNENSGWTKRQFGTNAYFASIQSIASVSDVVGVLSPQFIGVSYSERKLAVDNIIFIEPTDKGVTVRNTSFANLAAFTSWITDNNMTIYYALATPTDTEITDAALVAQLEAILSQGKTYAGTNNITTVIAAGNEQGELEIGYYTRYEFEITAGGYEWEQGGSGGPTIVMNESIDNVYPIWTITGPITNPVLENTTTGEQIEYVGTIGEGQTLVIDMGAQTALLDGLNVVANIVGDFLSLAPGSNTLIYSVDSGDKASEIGWSEIVG